MGRERPGKGSQGPEPRQDGSHRRQKPWFYRSVFFTGASCSETHGAHWWRRRAASGDSQSPASAGPPQPSARAPPWCLGGEKGGEEALWGRGWL